MTPNNGKAMSPTEKPAERSTMDESRPIPASLKAVAIVFIVGGAFAAIEVLLALFRGHILIHFGVLGLFIGPGLLALRPCWRTCALVCLWIGMTLLPFVALVMLGHPGALDITITLFGQHIGHASRLFALAALAVSFGLVVWQYQVLTRPDVRAIFAVTTGGTN